MIRVHAVQAKSTRSATVSNIFIISAAMQYLIPIVLGAVGAFLLYKGAILFLDHSTALARYWHVPVILIALTIVALGTSLPELVVGIVAGLDGNNDIVLGNVLGSNMANIGLVLGISAIIFPIQLRSAKDSRFEFFGLLLSVAVVYATALDGQLSRVDGFVLTAVGIAFIIVAVRYHASNQSFDETVPARVTIASQRDRWVSLLAIAAGLSLLFVGARMIVTNAIVVARLFHISEVLIGLTLVAIGTSLPEIVTSIVGSLRKDNDIVLGNVVGSNILNLLIVLGLTLVISPIAVTPTLWKFDLPLLLVATVSLVGLLYTRKTLGRVVGYTLVLMYGLYILLSFMNRAA